MHRAKPNRCSFLQTREHLSKAQRGLVGDGVSEVMTKLKETSSDGTSYSGDLLAIVDVLKNMTEIFRRSYYSPSSTDMRVNRLLEFSLFLNVLLFTALKWENALVFIFPLCTNKMLEFTHEVVHLCILHM